MHGESSRDVVRHLRTLYRCGVVGPLSDEQLLDRFLAHRDEMAEEAFTELVQRHGPMVLGVCRRILGDAHEAEDAFQATFLVLARKARSVVRRDKVANWLYGVAVRTAREARGRAARRRTREERVSIPISVEPPDDGSPDELRAILDEELARLPARYRGPVVLCELEGLSRPEAARRLDIPEGTLSSRLSRAKAQLRDRLARRGVTVPAVVLSAALIREARAISLPISLIEATVEAATHVAAGASATAVLSASVASLSEGVLKAMLFAKLKGVSLGIGVMTAVVSGAVVLAQSGPPTKGVVPLPSSGPVERQVETKVEAPPSEGDRTAALEKKLDRILDALDRLSRPTPAPEPELQAANLEPLPPHAGSAEPSPRHVGRSTTVSRHPTPVPTPAAEVDPIPTASRGPSPEPVATPSVAPMNDHNAPPPPDPTPMPSNSNVGTPTSEAIYSTPGKPAHPNPRSITDRINVLEQQMQLLKGATEQISDELNALRKQVGGAPDPEAPSHPSAARR
jgi:RNA polymerase sigma factor (sigma-70 family)